MKLRKDERDGEAEEEERNVPLCFVLRQILNVDKKKG